MSRYLVRNVPFALDCGPLVDTTYIAVSNASSQVLAGTDSLTVFLRFKPRRTASQRQLFAIPATAGNNRRYITQNVNNIDFTLGASAAAFTIAPYVLNEWQSIAMVVDVAAQQFKAYMNGVLVKDSTSFIQGTGTATLTVGGNSAALSYSSSKISDFKIWNRVLTAAEIQLVDSTGAGVTSSLRCELPLTEGSGSTVTDTSGNSNTGTVNNPNWTTDTPFKARSAASGRVAGARTNSAAGRLLIS